MSELFTKYRRRLAGSTLLKNSFWAVFGSAVLRGAGLIAGIYIARMLGADKFGVYGLFKNFVLSLAVLSTFGLGYTATKFIAENTESPQIIKKIMKNAGKVTLAVSVIISLIIIVFSDSVAVFLFKDAGLSSMIPVVAVWLFFTGLSTLQQAFLAGLSMYKELAWINTVIGVLSFFLSLAFTWYWSLSGALYALLLTQIFNYLLNSWKLKGRIPVTGESRIEEYDSKTYSLVGMLKTNIPVTLHDLSFSFFGWLGSYLLITFYNYSQVGEYAAASQWFLIIVYIPGVLKNVMLGAFSAERSNEGTVMKKMLTVNFAIVMCVAFIIIIVSPWIGKLYGDNYEDLVYLVIILSLAAVVTAVSNVYIQALVAKGKFWFVLYSRLLYDLLTVGFFYAGYLFLKELSLSGAMLMAVSFFVSTLLYLILIKARYRAL